MNLLSFLFVGVILAIVSGVGVEILEALLSISVFQYGWMPFYLYVTMGLIAVINVAFWTVGVIKLVRWFRKKSMAFWQDHGSHR